MTPVKSRTSILTKPKTDTKKFGEENMTKPYRTKQVSVSVFSRIKSFFAQNCGGMLSLDTIKMPSALRGRPPIVNARHRKTTGTLSAQNKGL